MSHKLSAVIMLLLVLLTIGGAWYVRSNLVPMDLLSSSQIEVIIPQGSSARDIGAIVERAGLVRSGRFFSLYARATGKASKLRSGRATLCPSMDLPVLLDALLAIETKPVEEVRVTFPEGITLAQMAEKVAASGLCSAQDFLEQAGKISWQGLSGGEGLLFPDTYFFSKGISAESIVARMHRRFLDLAAQDLSGELPLSMSLDQALVLASIVERECAVAEERPKVAGVFINRLSRKMKLESCATVIYVSPPGTRRVTDTELAIDSPYNTYRNAGLPPGPICCPGRASMKAAAAPVIDKWLYFVAAGDGTHHFSATLKEHNKYKQKLKRLLRKRAASR